ncbi:MAG: hypothetical protein AB7Q42_18985 [Acidimicrobiia bacterium]
MTAAMTTMKKWQDEYMTFVARVEEPVVRYTGRAVEAVAEYVPERPAWAFLDQVPTMTELVDNQLKFRKRVVDEQAAFVRKMMKAMHPALVKLETKASTAKAPMAKAAAARPARARRGGLRAA